MTVKRKTVTVTLGHGYGQKKQTKSVVCLHKLLYAAVISQVYEICNLIFNQKKKKNPVAEPLLHSQRGGIQHACDRTDLHSGFIRAGHFR